LLSLHSLMIWKIFFLIFLIPFFSIPVQAMVEFEDVTQGSGISYTGTSWGSSWGDFNGDGWPDLWTSNHGEAPNLFLNNGNETFTDISSHFGLESMYGYDMHGSSWSDFDNDGDQDLLVLVGAERGLGQDSNFFFINDNGKFEDNASLVGLDYPLGSGRTPLWFDYDKDGLLDAFLINSKPSDKSANTAIFHQSIDGTFEQTKNTGLEFNIGTGSIQISDLSLDGNMDLVVLNPNPLGIFMVNKFPFQNIQDNLNLPSFRSRDHTISDFNGDLLPDIFFVTTVNDKSVVYKITSKKINAYLVGKGEQKFSFKTLGAVYFDIRTHVPKDNKIFLGSDEYNPVQKKFKLSPNDQKVLGKYKNKSDLDNGILIDYNRTTNYWTLLQLSKNQSNSNIIIESTMPILETNFGQLDESKIYPEDKLFINSKKGFIDKTDVSGLKNPTACRSVVSGDFDNDMDVDIYQVCSNFVKNLQNIFYENDGNGNFQSIENIGLGGSINGIGDTVSTVDYNEDGFLDIFVTNGFALGPFSSNGPSQLFRNLGNDNHWLEIDLEGTLSNRDGTGSRILLTVGDTKQIREQNSGMHFRTQNHQRIHFGLGNYTEVDSIVVFWPSGLLSVMKNVGVNQILKIIEPNLQMPPHQQTQLGIEQENVKCRDGLELIFKLSTGQASCVKPNSAISLIEREWGKIPEKQN